MKNKNSSFLWWILLIAIIVSIEFLSVRIISYNKGYLQGTKDYPLQNNIYSFPWGETSQYSNQSSEMITFNGSIYYAGRINHEYYSLSFNNIHSDESYDLFCITPGREDSRCELTVWNSSCVRTKDPLSSDYDCSKNFIYKPEEGKNERN